MWQGVSNDYFLAPDEDAQKTAREQEKQKEKEAEEIINEKYFNLDIDLTAYQEYRVLTDTKRLKAIEFYNAHNFSIPDMIHYIQKGINND